MHDRMGILEKLRPQPRWKHTDPAVRAAAVYELAPEEVEPLLALARDDADARVRRAAVTRLDDATVLGEIAEADPDGDVRNEAVRGLAGVAMEAEDPEYARVAIAQLLAIGRMKEAALVARDGTTAPVRAEAVRLIDDPKALGSISRHARDGETRLLALVRLSDVKEIVAVALKSEHTDAAVAALERVDDREALGTIAQRGRSKVAARRARARLRALEDAERPASDPMAQMSAEDRERVLEVLRRAEELVTVAGPDEAAAALADVRLSWAELQADVEVDATLAQQVEAASDAAREAIAERRREREAEQDRMAVVAREQADRVVICVQTEELSGPDAANRAAELKVQWDGLPPMPSEYAASLNRRFQDALRAFEERERRRRLAEAAVHRLEALAGELEQLVGSDRPLDEVVRRWRGLRRDAEVLREHASANPEAGQRLEQCVAALEEKEQQHHAVQAQQELENLKRLQQVCRQVEILAAAEEISLKAGDRALRDIQRAFEGRVPLPSKKDGQEIQARLNAARTLIGPRVQELREVDDWQRWANLQVQEELCREMEALKGEENLDAASRRMRDLQGRWKRVALAPRAQGEAMWRRFKAAQDEVFERTSAHRAARHEERTANLVAKLALVERVEALAESRDWANTAKEIQALQAQWKSIGAVTPGQEKKVWERFRASCDHFFKRRHEDLKRRKDEWAANLAQKEELCEKAEAIRDSTEWAQAATEFRQLQARWKTIGPVRKSKSDHVWQRFRAACDHFFGRYKHRDQVDLLERAAPREAIIRELESFPVARDAESVGDGEAVGMYQLVQSARARWQQAPELPRQLQQELAVRYHDAIGRLIVADPEAFAGTDLDPEATRQRMEALIAKVEELLRPRGAKTASPSPTELLAQQLRERLATNTMGGGRGTEDNESRWRAAEQEVRGAQTQWARLGPVPPSVAGSMNERFQRACRRFYDERRRAS